MEFAPRGAELDHRDIEAADAPPRKIIDLAQILRQFVLDAVEGQRLRPPSLCDGPFDGGGRPRGLQNSMRASSASI